VYSKAGVDRKILIEPELHEPRGYPNRIANSYLTFVHRLSRHTKTYRYTKEIGSTTRQEKKFTNENGSTMSQVKI
jgi:hypothetical protein